VFQSRLRELMESGFIERIRVPSQTAKGEDTLPICYRLLTDSPPANDAPPPVTTEELHEEEDEDATKIGQL
jgi:hypothetical protein